MSKLDPKPTSQRPLKTWEDLNSYLQIGFSRADKDGPQPIFVEHSRYEPSKEEIIEEGRKQGYKVSEDSDSFLKFE